MQRPIKGYIARQPEPEKPDFGYGVASIGILINDLQNTKKDVIQASDIKLSEIDDKLEQVDKSLKEGHQKVQQATETLKGTTQAILDHVASITQGPAGMDADEERVVNTVLERIPKFDENKFSSSILAQVPKIDETSLLKKFIQQIPKNKADLKIVQETFETDPMSVITKILEMGDTFKLKTTHIEGLDQTMSAFRNQLSRGYLHGGGLSTVSHDNTLSGLGTPASPLSVVGAPASSITGLISAGTDISITGSGTIASPYVINSVVGAGATLATVSAASTTTPNSLYTMTSTIPVEFKTSGGTHLLYLDETNGRVGIRNAAPVSPLHVTGLADNTSTTALFEQNGSGIGIIQLGNAAPSQNAKFIFNDGADNLLTIQTNYSLGSNNAIAFSPGGTETVRFKQGGLNGFGTNAPTHTITLASTATGIAAYNTSDQTTNYERVRQFFTGNVYDISSENGGTGVSRDIYINTNSNNNGLSIRGNGRGASFQTNSGSAVAGGFFNSTGTFNGASINQIVTGIAPTIAQTGTSNYTAFLIDPFEQTVGSGSKLLIDAGTNSAANGSGTHTSVFNLNSTGTLSIPGSAGGNGRIILGTGTGINARFALGTDGLGTGSNFGTSGFGLQIAAATYSSTSSTGTIAVQGTHTFGIPTLAASNATTLTAASTVYIDGAPTAGTNVTITNPYSLYVNAGQSLFGGNLLASGGIFTATTATSNTNFFAIGGNVIGGTTSNTLLQFGGSSNVQNRVALAGSTSTTISAGINYASLIIGSSPVTTAATGTHSWLANQVINPLGTVTSGGAAITNTSTLYIGGASSAGTNNFSLNIASGAIGLAGSAGSSGQVLTSQGAGASAVWSTVSGGSGITRSVNVVSTATGAGSTAATDYVYLVSGTTTITLPTAVGNTNLYTVTRTGTNTVTVATTGGQTINGAATATLLTQYETVSFISDNSNWYEA